MKFAFLLLVLIRKLVNSVCCHESHSVPVISLDTQAAAITTNKSGKTNWEYLPFIALIEKDKDTSEYWRETEILSLVRNKELGIDYEQCEQDHSESVVRIPSRRTVRPICRRSADYQLCPQCPHLSNYTECELFKDSCRERRVHPSEYRTYCDRKYGKWRAVLIPADYSQCRCCDECVFYRELDQSCVEDEYNFDSEEFLPVTTIDFRAGCNPYWGHPEQEQRALKCDQNLRRYMYGNIESASEKLRPGIPCIVVQWSTGNKTNVFYYLSCSDRKVGKQATVVKGKKNVKSALVQLKIYRKQANCPPDGVPVTVPSIPSDSLNVRRSFRYEPPSGGAECPTSCRGYDCGALEREAACARGAFLPDSAHCNCCGRCSAYYQLNQKCAEFKKTVHDVNGTKEIEVEEEFLEPGCDDGLVCRQGKCQDIHTVRTAVGGRRKRDGTEEMAYEPCKRELKYFKKKYGPDGHLHFDAPQCTPLWLYAPVQCRKFVCYCALEDGTIIQGIKVPRVEVSNMNCDCAREKCRTGASIECDGYGNYKQTVFAPHLDEWPDDDDNNGDKKTES